MSKTKYSPAKSGSSPETANAPAISNRFEQARDLTKRFKLNLPLMTMVGIAGYINDLVPHVGKLPSYISNHGTNIAENLVYAEWLGYSGFRKIVEWRKAEEGIVGDLKQNLEFEQEGVLVQGYENQRILSYMEQLVVIKAFSPKDFDEIIQDNPITQRIEEMDFRDISKNSRSFVLQFLAQRKLLFPQEPLGVEIEAIKGIARQEIEHLNYQPFREDQQELPRVLAWEAILNGGMNLPSLRYVEEHGGFNRFMIYGNGFSGPHKDSLKLRYAAWLSVATASSITSDKNGIKIEHLK